MPTKKAKKNVVTETATTAEQATPVQTTPVTAEQPTAPNKLTKSSTDRMISGVCAGIAEYLSVDPVFIRLLFVVLAISGGSGVLAYLILTFILPEKESVNKSTQEILKENGKNFEETVENVASQVENVAKRRNSQTWSGFIVILLGFMFLGNNFGVFDIGSFFSVFFKSLWPLFIIGVGLMILTKGKNE